MSQCYFVSDLHGRVRYYQALFSRVAKEPPAALFMGGDLTPSLGADEFDHFTRDFLAVEFDKLKRSLGGTYPRVFAILGNDDHKRDEADFRLMEQEGLIQYIHQRSVKFEAFSVYGYACVPPSPFLNKDWERYDVSRYVDPGSIPVEEGWFSEGPSSQHLPTIAQDLEALVGDADLSRAIFLFHAPPYQTNLDRADLDGKKIDHVPLDVHIGSIAVRNLILGQEPYLTMHGHVHESARLSGSWMDKLGGTILISAAHDGSELALVKFNADQPQAAVRELIPI